MTGSIRVLSLYEGFFTGGARIVHTEVVAGLHVGRGQRHSVLSIASEARRESTIQSMHEDPRYLRLTRAGVDVVTLGRTAGAEPPDRSTFTDREMQLAADAIERADIVLSLKEQPLGLLLALQDRGLMPDRPVAVCLHRSDPTHSGPALGWLAEGIATGLVRSTISCADSTSDVYARVAGVPGSRHVIPNGVDTDRFRPGTADEIAETRRRLGIPEDAGVVVYAARFDAMKNPGLFLRAVAAHAPRHPRTHYLLCGAGMSWENEAFRALVEDSGVPRNANLHPLGIRDDMPAIFQVADIAALTSAFGEASPLCLLEGAACGATPVATDVGDCAREIEGFGIVTSHHEDDIAAAWEDAFLGRDALRRAAIAARPRLGQEQMIWGYHDALESLVRVEQAAA